MYDSVIKVTSDSYDWLPKLQEALKSLKDVEDKKVILFSEREKYSGILGLANCLLKEYGSNKLKLV